MVELRDHPEKYLNKEFMLGIFDVLKPGLPPFGEYLDHMFSKRKTASIGGKEVLLSKLRDEIFDPDLESNQQSTEHLLPLVKVISKPQLKK